MNRNLGLVLALLGLAALLLIPAAGDEQLYHWLPWSLYVPMIAHHWLPIAGLAALLVGAFFALRKPAL